MLRGVYLGKSLCVRLGAKQDSIFKNYDQIFIINISGYHYNPPLHQKSAQTKGGGYRISKISAPAAGLKILQKIHDVFSFIQSSNGDTYLFEPIAGICTVTGHKYT